VVRNREPRLTVRALRPLMSGLMMLGYDPVPFLHTQGIDSDLLLDPVVATNKTTHHVPQWS
jgi:hypothetical protein